MVEERIKQKQAFAYGGGDTRQKKGTFIDEYLNTDYENGFLLLLLFFLNLSINIQKSKSDDWSETNFYVQQVLTGEKVYPACKTIDNIHKFFYTLSTTKG